MPQRLKDLVQLLQFGVLEALGDALPQETGVGAKGERGVNSWTLTLSMAYYNYSSFCSRYAANNSEYTSVVAIPVGLWEGGRRFIQINGIQNIFETMTPIVTEIRIRGPKHCPEYLLKVKITSHQALARSGQNKLSW